MESETLREALAVPVDPTRRDVYCVERRRSNDEDKITLPGAVSDDDNQDETEIVDASAIHIPHVPQTLERALREVSEQLNNNEPPAEEFIVSVFVARFDTLKGNLLEWSECLPGCYVDLEGVEYQAIASGFHKVANDFVYFKHGHYFGIACFNNMQTDNIQERGARMRSVGILSTSHASLGRYQSFLAEQATQLNKQSGDYSRLQQFFTAVTEQSAASPAGSRSALSPFATQLDLLPLSSDHFVHFIHFFGANVMLIWKALMLQRRILFYTPVPVGVVCQRVHAACQLLLFTSAKVNVFTDPNPLFYINLNDMDEIERERTFVACTTEKIFGEKRYLCDVYIDNQNLMINSRQTAVLKLTKGDVKRFRAIKAKLTESSSNQNSPSDRVVSANPLSALSPSEKLKQFFLDLNNHLLRSLAEASVEGREISPGDLVDFGLHKSDTDFMRELIRVYQLKIELLSQSIPAGCSLFT